MSNFKVVAAKPWAYGNQSFKEGDEVGEVSTDLAPFLLFDGVRSGQFQIQDESAQARATEENEPAPDLGGVDDES